jgi:hypothetical protein
MTLFAALAFFATPRATLAAERDDARALARAMRSDEIAVAGAKRAFLAGALDARYGTTRTACVRKVDYADFTAGSAQVIGSVLTPQEIATALGFFRSDAGVKYVEGLIRRLRASQGEESTLPKVAGKEEISPAQVAAIADFSSSNLGRKIMGKEMAESPAALAFGRQIMDSIAAKCGGR